MNDAVRLAVGTFTRVPVPPPRTVDRRVAGVAMLLAPVMGLVLAVLPALVVVAVGLADGPPLLASALAIACLAWLTRGLHLDGLADVADALGSGTAPQRARAIMKDPSVGAFGVMTLVLVLVLQVVALGSVAQPAAAAFTLVVAAVTGRLGVTLACVAGARPASESGLGAAVVGTVSRPSAVLLTLAVLLGVTMAAWVLDLGPVAGWPAAVVLGLAAGGGVTATCVRRLGGVNGDVLGASLEAATAAALVVVPLVVHAPA